MHTYRSQSPPNNRGSLGRNGPASRGCKLDYWTPLCSTDPHESLACNQRLHDQSHLSINKFNMLWMTKEKAQQQSTYSFCARQTRDSWEYLHFLDPSQAQQNKFRSHGHSFADSCWEKGAFKSGYFSCTVKKLTGRYFPCWANSTNFSVRVRLLSGILATHPRVDPIGQINNLWRWMMRHLSDHFQQFGSRYR